MISASIGSADRNSSAITTTSIQPIVTVVPSSFVHTTNSPHQPHPSHQPLDLLSNPALIISKTKSKLTASLFGQGSALPFRNRKHKLVTSTSRSSRPEKRLKIDPSEATSSISTPSIEDTPEMILLLDSRNHHHNKQSRLSSATSSASSSGEDNNSFLQLLPRNSNFCSEETDTEKDFDCTTTTGGTDRFTSSHSKYLANIQLVLDIWQGRMNHVHPETYLQHLLKSRGYDSSYLSSYDLKLQRDGFFHTDKELHDYDNEIIHAVRTSNIGKIRKLHHNGRSLTACNRFSESIVHMACRRADYSTVEYLLTNIPSVLVVDDYGRTPLHDACWRAEPQFDIVALLLDKYLDLIRCKDRRGASPLQYVQKDHWHLWCAFLDSQKEKYWAPIYNPNPSSAPMTSFSHHQSYHDADCSNNSSVPV